LHYHYAEWNARHTAATYGHLAILLVPFAHEGKQWSYRNSRAVPWPKLSEGLAALDRAAQADGMLVTDLSPDNFLVENGTGIIVDFDLHLAWGRDAFTPLLWLGCAGCSPSREAWLNQPTWCARINCAPPSLPLTPTPVPDRVDTIDRGSTAELSCTLHATPRTTSVPHAQSAASEGPM